LLLKISLVISKVLLILVLVILLYQVLGVECFLRLLAVVMLQVVLFDALLNHIPVNLHSRRFL